jgi:hypothetical protein
LGQEDVDYLFDGEEDGAGGGPAGLVQVDCVGYDEEFGVTRLVDSAEWSTRRQR